MKINFEIANDIQNWSISKYPKYFSLVYFYIKEIVVYYSKVISGILQMFEKIYVRNLVRYVQQIYTRYI